MTSQDAGDNGSVVEIDEAKNTLIIHELMIENKQIVDLVMSYPEESRPELLLTMLETAAKSMKWFLTENYGSVIDKHFSEGLKNIQNQLETNIFQNFLERARKNIIEDFTKNFGEKEETLLRHMNDYKGRLDKEVLSSFLEQLRDKVLSSFKSDFSNMVADLKESLNIYVSKEEEIMGGPKKGARFEDYVAGLAKNIGEDKFGDTVDHVGGPKSGDIIVENNKNKIRFVVEAKDTYLSKSEIKEEFERVESTWKVHYSMIVFRNSVYKDSRGRKLNIDPFLLYGDNRLQLAISYEQDEIPYPFLFYVGYRILRDLASLEKMSSKKVDTMEILGHIQNLRLTLKKVTALKSKVSSFANTMQSDLDEFEREILREVVAIEEVVKDDTLA